MAYSDRPVWTDFSQKELERLQITLPDQAVYRQVKENWDSVAKPLDSLGSFEEIIARIGAISGSAEIDLSRKAVLIFCGDNGIVEEGVSQSGPEVTAAVAKKMGQMCSSVGKMAKQAGADTIVVDIGMQKAEPTPGVLNNKIRCGTRNFLKEPAMTKQETVRAICTGIDLVYDCKKQGYGLIATGEMGIGNTTTSAALAAVLLGCEPERVTGRGAGLDDRRLARKKQVIRQAITQYDLKPGDPLTALQIVGGLDIAGLVGVCMGGALFHVPVVLDGVIALTAALTAERLLPGTKEFLIASHKGKEPAMKQLLSALELEAVIDGKLALGEGTGAVMLFALLDMALCIYENRVTFSDIRIEKYQRYEEQ